MAQQAIFHIEKKKIFKLSLHLPKNPKRTVFMHYKHISQLKVFTPDFPLFEQYYWGCGHLDGIIVVRIKTTLIFITKIHAAAKSAAAWQRSSEKFLMDFGFSTLHLHLNTLHLFHPYTIFVRNFSPWRFAHLLIYIFFFCSSSALNSVFRFPISTHSHLALRE